MMPRLACATLMNRTVFFLVTFTLLAALTCLARPPMAYAGGVVTNCANDSDFLAKLVGGGAVTFNCGTATIHLSSTKTIDVDTTIDGGGNITLSGDNAVRLFSINSGAGLTLKNIVLEKGYGGDSSGGAIINGGRLTLDRATIQYSYTPIVGGAIYSTSREAVEITNSTLAHNRASRGGAIYADASLARSPVTITGSTFDDNRADKTNKGGAIYSSTPLIIASSEFTNNSAGSGGAIYAFSTGEESSITGSNFHDNHTTGSFPNANGGALLVEDAFVSIGNTILRHNSGQSGGAVHVTEDGQLTVMDSTIKDNLSTNGGGIYNKGEATLTNVTVSVNQGAHGGAINNFGTLILANVTLSGNDASYGGGLKNEGGTATLTNVTLSDNSAGSGQGGGIKNTNANTHLNLKNVIVANSPTGGNCDFNQLPDSRVLNLSSDDTCDFGVGHDHVTLLLGPLANNGGKTQTHLPQTGSPAIDSGTNIDAPKRDQRGIARPQGAALDVGSVEVCQKPAKPILLKPRDGKRAQGPAVTLDWNDAVCAKIYKVVIRLGSKTGDRVQKKGGLTTSEFTTKPLIKGQTYAWLVKACNQPYGCAKSEWWTFKVK